MIAKVSDPEIEALVLSCAMLDHSIPVWLQLECKDFTSPHLRPIWLAMRQMTSDGISLDPALLRVELEKSQHGSSGELLEAIAGLALTAANVEHYATEMRTMTARRETSQLATSMKERIALHEDGDDLLGWVAERASELCNEGAATGHTGGEAIKMAISALLADADARAKHGITPGIHTGIQQLDSRIGGIPRGVVTIVGARPAEGKSSLALSMAMAAASAGHGVHILTLEDRAISWGQRMIANLTHTSVSDIRSADMGAARRATGISLPQWASRIHIEHAHGFTAQRCARAATVTRKRLNTQLVIIDYLQLIAFPEGSKGVSRNDAISRDMETFAQLSGKENLAVVCLSQLNRAVEKRADNTPQLSDMRDSGSIEQVGKLIMSLASQYDAAGERTNMLQINVLKNHQGPLGNFLVRFDREFCRIH